jgi:hypothetical protein
MALVLPLVVVMVLAVAQVLVTGGEQVALHHAVREAARAASLAETAAPHAAGLAAGRRAAEPTLDPARLELAVLTAGEEIQVSATYRATPLPLVGRLLGPRRLEARAVMRREP